MEEGIDERDGEVGGEERVRKPEFREIEGAPDRIDYLVDFHLRFRHLVPLLYRPRGGLRPTLSAWGRAGPSPTADLLAFVHRQSGRQGIHLVSRWSPTVRVRLPSRRRDSGGRRR